MEVLNNQLCTKIFCVIPASSSETTCTENLILAKNFCQEHNLNVVCILENDCLKSTPSKECVFVLNDFDSPLFEFLQSFECKVVGPQCLLNSLKNGQPIPSTAVFNLAMKGIVVTTTGLTMPEKMEAEKKIQFMGGIYSSNLTLSTTHLIAKSVADFGLKFKAVRSRAIPIMLPKWIDEVWSARISQEIVHGNDPKYSSHVCPVFLDDNSCETIEVANDADASTLPVLKLPLLHDVLAFISHDDIGSKYDRTELMEIVRTLGGRVCIDHCQEVTHFVCQGELGVSEEMRKAKEWNQIFVKPQWILDCEDSSCRLEEDWSCYQPPLNFETAVSSDVVPVSPSLEEENTLQVEQTVSQQISLSSDAVARKGFEPDAEDLNLLPAPLPNSSFARVTKNLNQSQRRNAFRYYRNLFRVMFSGMDQEDRDSYIQIIETLGGIAIDSPVYDATCTHLVVAKLECNDKLMTSIAAGKWIVHPGWIEESEEAYRFVDERKFEWGSSTSNVSISKEEASIAAAAYHWRTCRNRGLLNGPFQGISAVLHLGKKNDVFQNLLEAGGGKMVAPELALENGETNFCVLDSHEVHKIQLSEYASKGIYCVPPTYFRDLILALDEKLQLVECVLPEFLPYLNLTLSSRI